MRLGAAFVCLVVVALGCKSKHSSTDTGDGTPTCGSWGDGCSADSDCCENNGTCLDGVCKKALGASCASGDECGDVPARCAEGTCCTAGACVHDSDCCDRTLGYVCRSGSCCVGPGGFSGACLAGSNPDCCSGNCNDETCL